MKKWIRKIMIRTFRIRARYWEPITLNWRDQLIQLMGVKPRRLSLWCELGLLGALSCIKTANITLTSDHQIRVYSEQGTFTAIATALEQTKEDLPMPFTFMQTQPGQLFNALGTQLNWHGDGYVIFAEHIHTAEEMLLSDIADSGLIGWVDEEPELQSWWLWLEEAIAPTAVKWQPIDSLFHLPSSADWLKFETGSAQLLSGK
jgi:hypothetical protein